MMLQPLLDVLKDTMRPSSPFACLLLMLVGVLLLYSKAGPKWGRRWLIGVLVGYWIISTPLGAGLLVRGLKAELPIDRAGIRRTERFSHRRPRRRIRDGPRQTQCR